MFHIKKQKWFSLGYLNELRQRPKTTKINNYLYVFGGEGVNSIERVNLFDPNFKWDHVQI